MLAETFNSMATATRNVFRNWQAMGVIAIVYASLLAVLYFFVIVREATVVQITLTFASAIVAPILFFVLQTMVANENETLAPLPLLRRSLTSFWKIVLVTLPLIALAVLVIYLLGKAQVRFDTSASEARRNALAPRGCPQCARCHAANRLAHSHPVHDSLPVLWPSFAARRNSLVARDRA